MIQFTEGIHEIALYCPCSQCGRVCRASHAITFASNYLALTGGGCEIKSGCTVDPPANTALAWSLLVSRSLRRPYTRPLTLGDLVALAACSGCRLYTNARRDPGASSYLVWHHRPVTPRRKHDAVHTAAAVGRAQVHGRSEDWQLGRGPRTCRGALLLRCRCGLWRACSRVVASDSALGELVSTPHPRCTTPV